MSNPDRQTRNVRYRQTSFGVIAAGATSVQLLTTPDDAKRRLLTGIMATPQAINIKYSLKRAGYDAADLDGSLLIDQQGFVILDLMYDIGIQIELDLVNSSAVGSVAAGVTLRYELPDDSAPY